MPSLKQVLAASALVSLGAAAPTEEKRAAPMEITQAANPKFVKNGPAAYAKALAKYGAPTAKIESVLAAAPGSVAANPEQYDSEYLSPVQIQGKTFNLDFDTGSSDLWVFGAQSGAGGQHQTYTPNSSSQQISGATWKISYGDGSSASGTVYKDTVKVGKTTVTGQAVEVANKVSQEFADGAPDGLLGLGFSSINTVRPTPQKTFFDNAVKQGLPNVFAADLKAGKAGKYDFGGIDSAYSSSSVTYTSVDSSDGFWMFQPSGVKVGSSSRTLTAGPGIADTGTTLMLLDDAIVSAYYAQVSGAEEDSQQGGYVFPCNAKLPNLTVSIKGHNAVVPGSYINFAPVDESGSTCFGGIQSDAQIGFAIYGDVFLKSQYVVFDQTTGSPRLGLANKAS